MSITVFVEVCRLMVHVYDLGHGVTCSLARDMSGKDHRALILAIELPESFQVPPREAAGAPLPGPLHPSAQVPLGSGNEPARAGGRAAVGSAHSRGDGGGMNGNA